MSLPTLPAHASAPSAGTAVGNYRIVKLLGEGGMGSVYLGENPMIGSQVAIKVLRGRSVRDPSAVKRLLDEARAVNRVRHPSLVRIHDGGYQKELGTYLVMELLEGRSLREELQARGALPAAEVVGLVGQAAAALAQVHRYKVIHRDLKPENLYLVADPAVAGGRRIKILDFGLAKLLGKTIDLGARTVTGSVLGTPLYMSPEQLCDSKRVDRRTDIYALGVIAYEMLSARLPFEADTLGTLVRMQLAEQPTPIRHHAPNVPAALEQAVLRALARNPEERYATADEFSAALAAALGEPVRLQAGLLEEIDTAMPATGMSDDVTQPPDESLLAAAPRSGPAAASVRRAASASRSATALAPTAVPGARSLGSSAASAPTLPVLLESPEIAPRSAADSRAESVAAATQLDPSKLQTAAEAPRAASANQRGTGGQRTKRTRRRGANATSVLLGVGLTVVVAGSALAWVFFLRAPAQQSAPAGAADDRVGGETQSAAPAPPATEADAGEATRERAARSRLGGPDTTKRPPRKRTAGRRAPAKHRPQRTQRSRAAHPRRPASAGAGAGAGTAVERHEQRPAADEQVARPPAGESDDIDLRFKQLPARPTPHPDGAL